MRTFDVAQGSDEWKALRAGVPTGSEFSSILAKGQGKSRATYLERLVAERLVGGPIETFKNANMERGNFLEPAARAEYEIQRLEVGVMVDQIGFVMHDEIEVGVSPDGLVLEDGGCEIKSVLPTTHVRTILAGGYPSEHRPQVQGNLWITNRKWWDFVSYCPEMKDPALRLYVFRVVRDEAFIAELESEVRSFIRDIESTVAKIKKMGGVL